LPSTAGAKVGLIKILLTSEACTAAAFGLAELFGASFEVLLRVCRPAAL
jgi:hypothetical protein